MARGLTAGGRDGGAGTGGGRRETKAERRRAKGEREGRRPPTPQGERSASSFKCHSVPRRSGENAMKSASASLTTSPRARHWPRVKSFLPSTRSIQASNSRLSWRGVGFL